MSEESDTPPPSLRALLRQATRRLDEAGCDTPRLDAEVLWMHASGESRTGLIVHAPEPVPMAAWRRFQKLLQRRLRREPVAYITGEKEFWRLRFEVSPQVLIPRPETEAMIENLLQLLPDRQRAWRFADIGTGSGCIAVSLAREYPHAHIFACDISPSALQVARRNAHHHGVAERLHFVCCDLLEAIQPSPFGFDAILANPPYIAAEAMRNIAPELRYEPQTALTDHGDGLRCMRRLLAQAPSRLRNGGLLCIESGLAGHIHEPPPSMPLLRTYQDLAHRFRGAIYRHAQAPMTLAKKTPKV